MAENSRNKTGPSTEGRGQTLLESVTGSASMRTVGHLPPSLYVKRGPEVKRIKRLNLHNASTEWCKTSVVLYIMYTKISKISHQQGLQELAAAIKNYSKISRHRQRVRALLAAHLEIRRISAGTFKSIIFVIVLTIN